VAGAPGVEGKVIEIGIVTEVAWARKTRYMADSGISKIYATFCSSVVLPFDEFS
jgi:hypothetical protein